MGKNDGHRSLFLLIDEENTMKDGHPTDNLQGTLWVLFSIDVKLLYEQIFLLDMTEVVIVDRTGK